MAVHDFSQKLGFSAGANVRRDMEQIAAALGGACVRVEKTDVETDKAGIDYMAYLRNGAAVGVDAKRRERHCSRFWRDGVPELAIETYSVFDTKPGWTFSSASDVDYILYSFEPQDSDRYFFLPFQLLRLAALGNVRRVGDRRAWGGRFFSMRQDSGGWQSECIFVPAPVVLAEVQGLMAGQARRDVGDAVPYTVRGNA